MRVKSNVLFSIIVSFIGIVVCLFLYLHDAIIGAVCVIGFAALVISGLLKLTYYDFILILLPFMFYINIGGAINTSAADFLLLVWWFQNAGKLRDSEDNSIVLTWNYITNYAYIFIFIMIISLVNIIRWQNPLILQGIISVFKIVICFQYARFTLDYVNRFGRSRFLCVMAYSAIAFDVLMIVGSVSYMMGMDLGLTFSGTFRATGTFEDPNLAATYVFLMTSFALSYFSGAKKRILFVLTMLLSIIAVFLTASKGALVAIVVGLTFIVIVNFVRGNISTAFKLIFAYLLAAICLVWLYQKNSFVQELCEPILGRFEEFTGNLSGDHSLQHREFLWKTAFSLGLQEPILGIGVEQFRPAATQFTGQNVWNIVHNTYLTFFCELGIVGFLAFYRLWIKDAWCHFVLLKQNNSSIFYLLSILCVSVSMWSISLGNFRLLWIFMTFVLYESYSCDNNLKGV